jgi:hypothetical protein
MLCLCNFLYKTKEKYVRKYVVYKQETYWQLCKYMS